MYELLSREELEAIKQRVALAFGDDRGELLEYCPAHDYGDPGYPPDECAFCIFERDRASARLAIDVPRLLRHIEALERNLKARAEFANVQAARCEARGCANIVLPPRKRFCSERCRQREKKRRQRQRARATNGMSTAEDYRAYRAYAETVIEGRHTDVELQLAEMVLELLEALDRGDRLHKITGVGGTRDGGHYLPSRTDHDR